ncbi:inositol hexakisphosphate kinase 2-like isoform X1 [Lampetra planeri]
MRANRQTALGAFVRVRCCVITLPGCPMDLSPETGEASGHVLQPFAHLVGGHACVLRFNDTTICKPLLQREHQVYESLPPDIACFAPQYKGTVSLNIEERNGERYFVNYPQVDNTEDTRICEQQNGREGGTNGGMDFGPDAPPAENGSDVRNKDFCARIERLQKKFKDQNQHRFILLENLVSAYVAPCILDLKMGVRQYGDDAPEDKKALHTRTCQQSTSSVLGVRVSGMQVYHVDTRQYVHMDKYIGRKLSVNGFKETLTQFFRNGQRLRKELLEPVLRKLSELRVALERQDSYRFYSSSLLIIYEGQEECRVGNGHGDEATGALAAKVDVRMIDFAHTTCRTFLDDPVAYDGPDENCIIGLCSLIRFLCQVKQEAENVAVNGHAHETSSAQLDPASLCTPSR